MVGNQSREQCDHPSASRPNACEADPSRVAVVGGGISGLACARMLRDQGCGVTVFDRGRRCGGRMSTRHSRESGIPAFDHGAPYFTVRDPRFGRQVRSWIEEGVCVQWPATSARWNGTALETFEPESPLFVGVPSMHAVCCHLAADLDVRCTSSVVALRSDVDGWSLSIADDADAGPFDAVVLAVAPEQALRLTESIETALREQLRMMTSCPVWIGLFCFDGLVDGLPDNLEVLEHEAIERIVRNDRKPGRSNEGVAILTVHARSEWSAARYDVDREEIAKELAEQTRQLLIQLMGRAVSPDWFVHRRAHRWGLARPASVSSEDCFVDRGAGLAVCGDGFGGNGVEVAWLSGRAAAAKIRIRQALVRPEPSRRRKHPHA